MHNTHEDPDLLRTVVETGFVLDDIGRIVSENDPVRSIGPLFFMAGCPTGNVVAVGADVDEQVVREIGNLAADEPPFVDPEAVPVHLERYLELLNSHSTGLSTSFGLQHLIPKPLDCPEGFELVLSGTDAGDSLVNRLNRNGMPLNLLELDFRAPEDIWVPWCVAMQEDNVVSVGMTARLGSRGVKSGVVTVPLHRNQGFATAVVAGWSSHPELAGKKLFYSMRRDNSASRRVAEKLGLEFIGSTLRIEGRVDT